MNNCRLTAKTDFEGFCDNSHPYSKKGIHLDRKSFKKLLKIVVRMLFAIDGYRVGWGRTHCSLRGWPREVWSRSSDYVDNTN